MQWIRPGEMRGAQNFLWHFHNFQNAIKCQSTQTGTHTLAAILVHRKVFMRLRNASNFDVRSRRVASFEMSKLFHFVG